MNCGAVGSLGRAAIDKGVQKKLKLADTIVNMVDQQNAIDVHTVHIYIYIHLFINGNNGNRIDQSFKECQTLVNADGW